MDRGAYPRRFSSSEGAGENRRPSQGNDRRSRGTKPQNAGERRNPAAGGGRGWGGTQKHLQISSSWHPQKKQSVISVIKIDR